MYCSKCGTELPQGANHCPQCGAAQSDGPTYTQATVIDGNEGFGSSSENVRDYEKSKIAAGLLAIFLGSLGIHKFYLGYTTTGIIMLLITLIGSIVTFGIAAGVMGVIAIVEGILYLTMSDDRFERTYVIGTKTWF